MDFIQHSLNWTKGEIFERTLITVFAVVILVASFLFWKFGLTPYAKALVIPALLVGIVLLGSGISLITSNNKRQVEFQKAFEEDSSAFVQSEKKRVEDFQYLYTITKVMATLFFLFAVISFWFLESPRIQAIALALAFFGFAGLLIDYFSQERADIYYAEILNERNE